MSVTDKSPPISTQWLIDAAIKRGVSAEEISAVLDWPNVDPGDWASLPMDSYIRLFNWLSDKLDSKQLGLLLAKEVDIASFGGGTYMIYHAYNLRDCCQCLARYDQTISQGLSISFIENEHDSRLEYRVFQPPGIDVRQDIEMSLAMLVYFCRDHLGDYWLPKQVALPHTAPDEYSLHTEVFGTKVLFEQPVACLWFENHDLSARVSKADPNMLTIFRQHADSLQEKILRKNNLLEQVRYYIARTLGSDDCNIEAAAPQLFMSRRSLTRHLSQQGTSFRELRIEITKEVAKKTLLETKAPISEIAQRLGYSESSAFNRSFKSTTGYSPLEYRRKYS